VVNKSLGRRFTTIYLLTIVVFSVLFGLLINALGIGANLVAPAAQNVGCCSTTVHHPSVFRSICSVLLVTFIIIALSMKLFDKFKKQEAVEGTTTYTVEGMHCNHCKAAVEKAMGEIKGVTAAEVNLGAKTVTVTGTATADEVQKAVEKAGFEFKGENK
jgi:copper chaperone CopZ